MGSIADPIGRAIQPLSELHAHMIAAFHSSLTLYRLQRLMACTDMLQETPPHIEYLSSNNTQRALQDGK